MAGGTSACVSRCQKKALPHLPATHVACSNLAAAIPERQRIGGKEGEVGGTQGEPRQQALPLPQLQKQERGQGRATDARSSWDTRIDRVTSLPASDLEG